MPDATPELPRWRCQIELHAAKIAARCYRLPDSDRLWTDDELVEKSSERQELISVIGDWGLLLEDPRFGPVWCGVGWIMRHNPKPGGYFVVFEDGSTSYSPAPFFEETFMRMQPEAPPDEAQGSRRRQAHRQVHRRSR